MTTAIAPVRSAAGLALEVDAGGAALARLSGDWLIGAARPSPGELSAELHAKGVRKLRFESSGIAKWDSALVNFATVLGELCAPQSIEIDRTGLPEGVQRLLKLAEAVPEKKGARADTKRASWVARVGSMTLEFGKGTLEFVSFLGEMALAAGRLVRFKARFQARDLWLVIQECGADALPIVTLISFIVGLIMAFVGAVQLQQFGASIYVANLVVLAMAREMGAMMTAIIMAGRTGAAFAAQLGTMKVNEEIDALKTMGISPLDFLVLPRMIALVVMMPLLVVYANLVGVIGGAFVATSMLDVNLPLYINQTIGAATLGDFATGIFKAGVFGVLIAVSGCLRGMQTGNSASAVGEAATRSVVTSIVAIVVADGLFAVMFNILGI